jgi:hypothetical protein
MPVSSKRLLVRHAGINSRSICIGVEPETTPREMVRRYMKRVGKTDDTVFQDGRADSLVGFASYYQF